MSCAPCVSENPPPWNARKTRARSYRPSSAGGGQRYIPAALRLPALTGRLGRRPGGEAGAHDVGWRDQRNRQRPHPAADEGLCARGIGTVVEKAKARCGCRQVRALTVQRHWLHLTRKKVQTNIAATKNVPRRSREIAQYVGMESRLILQAQNN